MPGLRTLVPAALLAAAALSTSAAEAAEWRWKLQEGRSYAFEYRSTTDLAMTVTLGIAAEVNDRVGVDTDFELRVRRVLPDGRYDLEIPVTRLVVESATGHRVTLDDLPPQVRTLRAYMTPQGRFQFYERVVVEVREDGPYGLAVLRRTGEVTTGEVTAGDGEVEVTASATIDPNTGRVELRGEIRERQAPTRQVEEERPVQHVDVLPADLLALLELPEGRVSPGSRSVIEMPVGRLQVEAGDPQPCGEASCGQLRVRMDADSAPMTAQQPAADADPFGGDAFGMGGLGALTGSGMEGMGGGLGGSPASMATPTMRFDLDVTALFDPAAGRLFQLQGRGGSTTEATGMRMVEATTFRLGFAGVR